MKRIPFCTFQMNDKQLEGMITTMDKTHGINDTIISFELPDSVFGFKTCKINLGKLTIEEREGFTDEEMSEIIQIVKDNKQHAINIAKEGIIYA